MRTCLLISLLTLSVLLGVSKAHQQKEAYITILFNERTGNVEISHQFLLHDAEHGLGLILKGSGDLSTDPVTQARFAEYVHNNFWLHNYADESIELSMLGYEVEGKYFWVYQETPISETPIFKLKHTALHELWPNQTNHINVEKDGWVKSVRLQKKDSKQWHEVSLSAPLK